MPTYRADIHVANDNGQRRKRAIWLSILAIISLLLVVSFFQARHYFLDGLPKLPDKATMWEMNLKPNITLLDKDGQVIGHRGPYIGEPLKLDKMPRFAANAFLAIEDERFYEHDGIDNKAIFRALITNTSTGHKSQGASTLTQQLVKNMVLTPEKTYRRKVQEMLLARDMEARLSKPEILELYLNRINLGPQVFGIEAASLKYFGHSARTLNLSEAALLAALPKAPSRYDPTQNFEGALARSHLVLQRMTANGFITPAEEVEARQSPPVIVEDAEPLLDPDIAGYAFDLVTERAHELVGEKRQDLIVTTTLDTARQKQADAAIKKILNASGKAKNISQGALISLDNETGAVRALVGGRDYATSKFNRATQAERQPGSSFKSIVYAAAMEEGFTPGTIRIDQPVNINGWTPENYTRRYRGPITLREALKLSINTVAAQVGSEIGPTKIVRMAKRFGIKSEMRPEYSIALGTSEVNLLELTRAYSVFANEGLLKSSFFITEITDTAKRPLYTRRAAQPTRAYAVPYARQMTGMLRDVVDSGTGYGAKLGNRPAGGKTGTSQDYRDAWFVGFTAQYTTGIWMGNDDNSPTKKVTGGLLPVDAWKNYMLNAHKGLAVKALHAPDAKSDDPEIQRQVAFYESLSQALKQERDMANGITPSTTQFSTAGR